MLVERLGQDGLSKGYKYFGSKAPNHCCELEPCDDDNGATQPVPLPGFEHSWFVVIVVMVVPASPAPPDAWGEPQALVAKSWVLGPQPGLGSRNHLAPVPRNSHEGIP